MTWTNGTSPRPLWPRRAPARRSSIREADFNSRLIEVFGYPYPEDIGSTGTYPTGYTRQRRAIHKVVHFASDAIGALRGVLRVAQAIAATSILDDVDEARLDERDAQLSEEHNQRLSDFTLTTERQEFAALEQLKQLEQLIREQTSQRLEVFTLREILHQASGCYLAALARGQRWFVVGVVSAITISDSLGHEYVTRYRYHDGYHDGVEKEFRGFARVEQIEVGDAIAPTIVTRSFLDTGREHETLKGVLLGRTAALEDGGVFWDETTTWTTPPKMLMTGVNGQAVHYAHPTATARRVIELGRGEERLIESE